MPCAPARWHECGDFGDADAAGEAGQDVGQVGDGIDAGEPAAAENGESDRGALTAGVGAREEKILSFMQSTT